MEEFPNKIFNNEKSIFSPKINIKPNDNNKKSLSFRYSSKTNDSFKQAKERKSIKSKMLSNDRFSSFNNQFLVVKKPTFTKFLYNKFNPIQNIEKEIQIEEFSRFNLDPSTSVLNKDKFNISKNRKSGSVDICAYYDVLYNGAVDPNLINSNSTIIENRIENTFKFNSGKVIDSVLRSNKNRNEDNNLNDSFKYIGFSPPIRKVKNIFKSLKSQDSKDHSNSNSFINDEEKLNNKLFNNKHRNSHFISNKVSSILENTSISNTIKQEIDIKNQYKENNYFRNISHIKFDNLDKSNPSINSNLFNYQNINRVGLSTNSLKLVHNSSSNLGKLNHSYLSEANANKENLSKERSNSSMKHKNNDLRKSPKVTSFQTYDSIDSKNNNNSYINDNEEKRSVTEFNINNSNMPNIKNNNKNKKNFILKNIKFAKNLSKGEKIDNDEILFKRNLKRKIHSLLNNDCQTFCNNMRNKNNNFNEKMNNHLISTKYEEQLNKYHKNFKFGGITYNPLRNIVNLESIEKNFLTPEQVILEKISPLELKIIQSDVNYYIKNKTIINENPVLKVKSLKDIFHEEDLVEMKNRMKKRSTYSSFGKDADKRHQNGSNWVKAGNQEDLLTETARYKTGKSAGEDKFIPLYSSGADKGYPRLDLINKKFEQMFFNVDKKVGNNVLNENIIYDDFDKFNENMQDKIIRDLYDKNFSAKPMRNPGDNLDLKKKKEYFISKIKRRNKKYDKNINKIYQKIGEKFVENNFLKMTIDKMKQNFNLGKNAN